MRIDEMPAGREMDVLIAEKVMGWAIHSRNTAWWVKVTDENEVTTEVMGFTYGKDRFAPSTNIAAAWEVLRKLQQDFFINIVCGRNDGRKNGRIRFKCDIGYYDNSGEVEWYAEANTFPLALGRAALKSMGVAKC